MFQTVYVKEKLEKVLQDQFMINKNRFKLAWKEICG